MLHDPASRQIKAAKILAVLRDDLGIEALSHTTCLDVGCASGLIPRALAPAVGLMIGLEYEADSVRQMDAAGLPNLLFVHGDAQALPLADASLDLVICAQVYEHVPDAEALAAEIYRVLKPGGHCFFSGPNRLDVIERHYGLPLLSWLPRPLAHRYVRLTRRGEAYREQPRTLGQLRRLWDRFQVRDYTLALILNPERFAMQGVRALGWLRHVPEPLLRLLLPLSPNFNWMLTKPGAP
jgi:SAM-dependent methyltransferase